MEIYRWGEICLRQKYPKAVSEFMDLPIRPILRGPIVVIFCLSSPAQKARWSWSAEIVNHHCLLTKSTHDSAYADWVEELELATRLTGWMPIIDMGMAFLTRPPHLDIVVSAHLKLKWIRPGCTYIHDTMQWWAVYVLRSVPIELRDSLENGYSRYLWLFSRWFQPTIRECTRIFRLMTKTLTNIWLKRWPCLRRMRFHYIGH